MAEAYIVESLRTAGGRRKGSLAGGHPADLGAAVLNALVDRTGVDPAAIEDVIVGCVTQGGEQAFGMIGQAEQDPPPVLGARSPLNEAQRLQPVHVGVADPLVQQVNELARDRWLFAARSDAILRRRGRSAVPSLPSIQ